MTDRDLGEVFFEFHTIGNQTRVAAIHGRSGTEVVFAAPAGTPESQMKTIGLARLRHRLGVRSEASAPPKDDGPGILV